MINGFYALYPQKGGYAQLPWESPPNGQFSITIRFLPDTSSLQSDLFSLDSALSVGLSDGNLRLRAGEAEITSSETITARCENIVTLVYDGTKLTVCQNSISVIEKQTTIQADISCLRIGGGPDPVCIFQTAIYHQPLSRTDICKSLVSKTFPCHRKIDFTVRSLPADITLHQSVIENCVYALACPEGGFSMDYVRLPREHTLSLSVYLFEKIPADMVLFHTPKTCIKLEDRFGIGRPKIVIERLDHSRKRETATAFFVETKKWVNLTFVFDTSDIYVYSDDQFMMNCSYESSEETGTAAIASFAGCLGSCVIAGHAVSEPEIPSFLQRRFGAFDSDLLYLCDFSKRDPDEIWLESCKGKKLTSCGGRSVLLLGTDAPVRTDKNRSGPVSDRKYSEFVNWQIGVLVRLLVEWLHEQLGIYPNKETVDRSCNPWKIDVNLHHFIHRDILSMNEAQLLLYHYDTIDEKMLSSLILAMKQNGTLRKLVEYLYQEDEKQDSVDDILYWLLSAALMAAAIAAVLTNLKLAPISSPPRPSKDHDDDDHDDDDEKKKKTDVTIKQVSLKSDLRISYDMESSQGIATNEFQRGNAAVFVKTGNLSKPALEVTLAFRGDKDDFEISAENRDGRVISGCHESISADGNSQKTISLKIQPENFTKKYGKCRETLRWHCQSREGKQITFLEEMDFDLYFLEGKPCGPWSDTIPATCLDLCADCAGYAEGHSAGFFKDYINYIENSIQMNADTKRTCSRIQTEKGKISVFDADQFSRAYRRGTHNISQNDLLYSVAIFCYLNGNPDILTLGLSSGISYEVDGKEKTAPLLMRTSSSSRELYCQDEAICWVLSSSKSIYDFRHEVTSLPFSKEGTKYITGPADTDCYREKYYVEGSYCGEVCSLDKNCWRIGSISSEVCSAANEEFADTVDGMPDTPGFGVVVPSAGGYIHQDRASLDRDTQLFMFSLPTRNEYFNTICHSISAHQIDLVIADICNHHAQESFNYLNTFVDALYHGVPEEREEEPFIQIYHQITNRLSATLHRCLTSGNEYTPYVVIHFSLLALSSPGNLRWGNSAWNIAISDNFDPVKWFYLLSADAQNATHEGGLDNPCENGALIEILRTRYQADAQQIPDLQDNQPGFYLPHRDDGVRIQRLLDLGATVRIKRKYLIDRQMRLYPLIFSSSNRYAYNHGLIDDRVYANPPAYLNLNAAQIPLYYISPNAPDQWTRLP